MKILIQECRTERFFQNDGNWGESSSETREFETTLKAVLHCHEQNLRNVRIVLRFGAREYDVFLPVHDCENSVRDARSTNARV